MLIVWLLFFLNYIFNVLFQVILRLQESQLPSDDKLTQYFIKYV